MIKVSDMTNVNEYNFINETTQGIYEDRIFELKNAITKRIKNKRFYYHQYKTYGIYFHDIINGDKNEVVNPVFIKVPLCPLSIDILVAHFQNVGSDIDQSISLGEHFIAELFEKYYGGEIITKEKATVIEDVLYVGIHHNWELTLCAFYDEICELEINENIHNDIKAYIDKENKDYNNKEGKE